MTEPAERARAKALALFGAAAAGRPAIGLGQRRPADPLRTAEGAREVETLLTQIEHGVYA